MKPTFTHYSNVLSPLDFVAWDVGRCPCGVQLYRRYLSARELAATYPDEPQTA